MIKESSRSGKVGTVMVVGGGVAGIQASLDLANSGFYVHLVEAKPAIGGVMAQLDKTFPTNDCSMCIISPKLVECGRHLNIDLLTYAEVTGISGEPGNFQVELLKKARTVDLSKCTGCGVCIEACPIRYEVQLPEAERAARTAYAKATDEEVVTDIINRYRDEEGNLLPVLLDINRHFNWLPRCSLEHVSDELKIPLTEILRVASFYNAFSLVPRGRNIISVCLGTGCFVKGSPRILERAERELHIKHGQTTEDMLFSLEVVRCIGCCALAPAMRIGADTYGRLVPEAVPQIIKSYAEFNERKEVEAAAG
jgi:NADH:ubiquinone oxidoreductase subunit E/NAD-dependent dihydropyrimidine dehydrogenase PreA subunit